MVVPAEVTAAARSGDVAPVKRWLESGGDANESVSPDTSSSLRASATLLDELCGTRECVSVVSLLLDHGGRISRWHILVAAAQGCMETVRALLSHGADPSPEGLQWTALHVAARGPDHEMVALLLEHGADVNRALTYDDGSLVEGLVNDPPTPLMAAASCCQSLETVRLLLSRGADFNARTSPGVLVGPTGFSAIDFAQDYLRTRVLSVIPDGYDHREWWDDDFRLPGEVEGVVELLAAVRLAGSWRRYSNEPRKDLIVLQTLCACGRASPPAGVFAALYALPPPLVWTALEFWRSSRDPGAPAPNPRLVVNA